MDMSDRSSHSLGIKLFPALLVSMQKVFIYFTVRHYCFLDTGSLKNCRYWNVSIVLAPCSSVQQSSFTSLKERKKPPFRYTNRYFNLLQPITIFSMFSSFIGHASPFIRPCIYASPTTRYQPSLVCRNMNGRAAPSRRTTLSPTCARLGTQP